MANIIFRVGDVQKKSYEKAALGLGLSLSDWLKSLADPASGFDGMRQVHAKPGVPVEVEPVPIMKPAAREKVKGPKNGKVPSAEDVVILGEVLAGTVIKSPEDVGIAIAKCTAARKRGAAPPSGKVDAGKTESAKSAPRLAKNGKMYTGETAVQFGHQSWEIIIDGRRSWVFEKPEFEA